MKWPGKLNTDDPNSPELLSKTSLPAIQAIFVEAKLAKQVLSAAKRTTKKRKTGETISVSPSKKRKPAPSHDSPTDPASIEASLSLPSSPFLFHPIRHLSSSSPSTSSSLRRRSSRLTHIPLSPVTERKSRIRTTSFVRFSLVLGLLLFVLGLAFAFRFAVEEVVVLDGEVGVAVAAPANKAVVWRGFWLWKAAIRACLAAAAAATAMVTEAGRGVVCYGSDGGCGFRWGMWGKARMVVGRRRVERRVGRWRCILFAVLAVGRSVEEGGEWVRGCRGCGEIHVFLVVWSWLV